MAAIDELLRQAREALQQQRPADAERLARKALELSPDDYDTVQLLGAACLHQEKIDEGIAAMKRAAALRPEDAKAQYNLGSAYARAQRWNQASAAFQVAIQLDPHYDKAREALSEAVHHLVRHTVTSAEGGRLNIYCHYHPDRVSTDKCRQCGALICEDCLRMDYGTPFCLHCHQEIVAQREVVSKQRKAQMEGASTNEDDNAKKKEQRGWFGRRAKN